MTNPLSYGTLTTMPNGPGAGTDNLTALPSATSYGQGVLDFSAAPIYDCVIAPIKLKSNAAGTSASGTVTGYVITSEDNTVWTDAIAPATVADQSSKIVTATAAFQIAVTANATTYYTPEVSLFALLGYIPRYAALVMRNQSGAALDGTAGNFYEKYSVTSYV